MTDVSQANRELEVVKSEHEQAMGVAEARCLMAEKRIGLAESAGKQRNPDVEAFKMEMIAFRDDLNKAHDESVSEKPISFIVWKPNSRVEERKCCAPGASNELQRLGG